MKKLLNAGRACIIGLGLCICKIQEVSAQAALPAAGISGSTTDINIISIPFKIRPAVNGFPEQLNASFNAALYLGKLKARAETKYGYGIFLGLGSVTMNPFVTGQKIDYEYEGLAASLGLGGVYDFKRFNAGLALGFDHLSDKNKDHWIYQHKPWIGILFGVNLN